MKFKLIILSIITINMLLSIDTINRYQEIGLNPKYMSDSFLKEILADKKVSISSFENTIKEKKENDPITSNIDLEYEEI